MSLPVFFPIPRYSNRLSEDGARPLSEICVLAGASCRASGMMARRLVVILPQGEGGKPSIQARATTWGVVHIRVPAQVKTERGRARYALGALAFGLHDVAAKESIRRLKWSRAADPWDADSDDE